MNDKTKEKIVFLEKKKNGIEGNIKEIEQVVNDIEAALSDAQQKFFKAKRDFGDIHNVLMEKGRTDLLEEIEIIRDGKKHI